MFRFAGAIKAVWAVRKYCCEVPEEAEKTGMPLAVNECRVDD